MYKLVAIALVAASIMAQAATNTNNSGVVARTAAFPADELCLSGSGSTCTLCGTSRLGTNGICQYATSKIDHCRRFSSDTTCSECEEGYYLNNNACTAIATTDCAYVTPSAPTICTGCENGKLPTAAGSCTDGANCTLANCEICGSNTRCIRCGSRYSLTSTNTCVAQPFDNCAAVVTSSGANPTTTCSVCHDNHYHTGTSCAPTEAQDNVSIFSAIVALFAFVKLMA